MQNPTLLSFRTLQLPFPFSHFTRIRSPLYVCNISQFEPSLNFLSHEGFLTFLFDDQIVTLTYMKQTFDLVIVVVVGSNCPLFCM